MPLVLCVKPLVSGGVRFLRCEPSSCPLLGMPGLQQCCGYAVRDPLVFSPTVWFWLFWGCQAFISLPVDGDRGSCVYLCS